jgi:hypothetical protein
MVSISVSTFLSHLQATANVIVAVKGADGFVDMPPNLGLLAVASL